MSRLATRLAAWCLCLSLAGCAPGARGSDGATGSTGGGANPSAGPPAGQPPPSDPSAPGDTAGTPGTAAPAGATPSPEPRAGPASGCLSGPDATAEFPPPEAHLEGLESWPLPRVRAGTCTLAVDTGRLQVNFRLPQGLTPDAVLAGLRVDAPVEPEVSLVRGVQLWHLSVSFPAGAVGERLKVHWQPGAPGQGRTNSGLGLVLERQPRPAIGIERQRPDGTWEPLGACLRNPEGFGCVVSHG